MWQKHVSFLSFEVFFSRGPFRRSAVAGPGQPGSGTFPGTIQAPCFAGLSPVCSQSLSGNQRVRRCTKEKSLETGRPVPVSILPHQTAIPVQNAQKEKGRASIVSVRKGMVLDDEVQKVGGLGLAPRIGGAISFFFCPERYISAIRSCICFPTKSSSFPKGFR